MKLSAQSLSIFIFLILASGFILVQESIKHFPIPLRKSPKVIAEGNFLVVFGRKPAKDVCFKNVCVHSEIADSEDKRAKGLMFREGLAEDKGMLFIFNEETRRSFWMKNMKFPLDIIWISRDKKIIDININVPPCRDCCEKIAPRDKIKYVLEVKAGFVDKNQVKVGDRVDFK